MGQDYACCCATCKVMTQWERWTDEMLKALYRKFTEEIHAGHDCWQTSDISEVAWYILDGYPDAHYEGHGFYPGERGEPYKPLGDEDMKILQEYAWQDMINER